MAVAAKVVPSSPLGFGEHEHAVGGALGHGERAAEPVKSPEHAVAAARDVRAGERHVAAVGVELHVDVALERVAPRR